MSSHHPWGRRIARLVKQRRHGRACSHCGTAVNGDNRPLHRTAGKTGLPNCCEDPENRS